MKKIEREIKLAAWGGFELPALDDVVEGVTSRKLADKNLDAIYHDTADLRLARSGVSLRHRSGDDLPWTVKLPEGERGAVMQRSEISFDGKADSMPEPAGQLVRAFSRSAPLVPIARLKTRRIGVELQIDGEKVAEVVDDEVSVYHGRRLASRFREVEVEVEASAPPGLLAAVVDRLRAAGAGDAEPISKVVRALGPRALAAPDLPVIRLDSRSTMAEVVQAAIANAAVRITGHDPGVRMGDDPEDVHQARVGTRRLRSDLRTFRPLLDPEWVGDLRDEAGWLADLLGAVRDAEVLAERLERQATQLDASDAAAVEVIIKRLADDRETARAKLLEEMNGPRYAAFLERLVAAANEPVFASATPDGSPGPDPAVTPAAELLPGLVRRPWRRLQRAVRDLPDVPEDVMLHGVRILAKHTRYAAEAAAPAIGKPAGAFASAVAGVQGVLGDHQDACVCEEWLRRGIDGASPPREAMLIGQLIGLQRAEATRERAAWPAAWRKASDPALRRWMGDGAGKKA